MSNSGCIIGFKLPKTSPFEFGYRSPRLTIALDLFLCLEGGTALHRMPLHIRARWYCLGFENECDGSVRSPRSNEQTSIWTAIICVATFLYLGNIMQYTLSELWWWLLWLITPWRCYIESTLSWSCVMNKKWLCFPRGRGVVCSWFVAVDVVAAEGRFDWFRGSLASKKTDAYWRDIYLSKLIKTIDAVWVSEPLQEVTLLRTSLNCVFPFSCASQS